MKDRLRHKIKLLVMLGLTFGFFLVEITVGYMTGSLALVSDSFHMISDVLALIIGFACLWLSTKESKTNTYGWARTEIIGALINSVFLIALCFSIFVEAVQRMIAPDEINNPDLLLIVGGVGLGVNVLGLLIFCNETVGHHGHSHGDGDGHSHGGKHNHSHGNHSHGNHSHGNHSHGNHSHGNHSHGNHSHENHSLGNACDAQTVDDRLDVYRGSVESARDQQTPYLEYIIINTEPGHVSAPLAPGKSEVVQEVLGARAPETEVAGSNEDVSSDEGINKGYTSESDSDDTNHHDEPNDLMTTVSHIVAGPVVDVSLDDQPEECPKQEKKTKKTKSGAQMNIQGVFLHILGDALGSVVVIVSALLIKYCEGDWVHRVDPALSLFMVIIILASTIPLFKQSALILLQNVPKNMNVSNLVDKMKTEVEGLSNVHDLHVWQLVGSRVIASMHIRCRSLSEYVETSKKIKSFFHENGIHSSTIQPEFLEHKDKPTTRECYLECGPDLQCFANTCCSAKKSQGVDSTVTDQPTVFTSVNQAVTLPGSVETIGESRL